MSEESKAPPAAHRLQANPGFAADQIDRLDASDPEAAHGNADAIVLANVDPLIAAAYVRLVDRCDWWASA